MKNRNTKQKETILSIVNQINTFFTAEDLYNLIKKKDKNVSLATVYRFLNKFKEEGEVYSYLCDRKTVYSKEKKSHCHFICENSGQIIHFEIDNIDFLKNKIPGKITSFQLEVKGICEDCCKKD
ncbi:transcriptional repressor [Candidatus Woesearchaeota archaeon CG_4_10_14_0_2_um_filter_33_13]|nr:MAG: transcriptional repressor [Candidatus Woesearchaeota archaeon CG_4_10_14_0_2_um_filter_33_13]